MLRITTLILAGLALAPFAACTGDQDVDPTHERAAGRAEASALAGDWMAALAAEHDRVRDADPAFYDRILRLEPQRTRNGGLRFTDPVIHDPDAAPVLLHRLVTTQQDTVLRAALAEALPRTGGAFSDAALGLLAVEEDELVRSVLISTLRRAAPEAALAGLRVGLSDPSAVVRAEAARTTARRPDGAALADALLAALADEDAATRTEATRALSALRVVAALPSVRERLEDPDPAVRAAAERAVARLHEDDAAH